MNENNVDIQKITEEIKKEIAEKGLINDIPSFDEAIMGKNGAAIVNLTPIKRELDYLKRHEIHYYRDITSYHKGLAPVVTFVKRVIRKLCKFLGEPIVDEVNEYHRHMTRAMEQTMKTLELISAPVEKQTQLLEVHKYRQLAEKYAAVNYRLEKELSIVKRQSLQMKEQLEILKLQNESIRLKIDILSSKD